MHALSAAANDARMEARVEALLLARAADGDTRAFRELAALLARPALATAIRVLGDHALAEDAVQDAFARLWREAGRFDPGRGSFGGWWRRMLMNCALDGRRRLKPAQPLDDAMDVTDAAPDPLQQAEDADLAARVQAAAAALPARQRAALSLFYGDGLSMAEIGEVLETSEKAVEGLLLRGRAELKTRLTGLKDELK
ncbi:sigma-70 family RNA polymerase sigma factor [Sandaracinobacteroides hominis]|uniref:sigma-70 family RNA polymerase sigma factor n=1 Tax=Sandaracinobacteroides hominis TaxID=2780086 RepID=UPI0018F50481|nr:sigma-70 family RNA polymerase sigma factor [Sandaracinobacteroides hominis]